MLETAPLKKNKICLSDYTYQRDIENRLLMAQFSTLDLDVLEEILYSSLTIPIRKLAKNIDIDETELLPILEKFSKTGLLVIEDDQIIVDKEMRKYYESQIVKFDNEFKPGMEFLQGLLKKVPIHVLPTWYSIPRTSNNIFDSLIEKYLLTPQIFQRYLVELNFSDPVFSGIIHDLYHSPEFKISSKELIEKYGLTREQFEEYMLFLEFHFVCCLGYNKVGDQWKEIVTPFHEWKEYLIFLRESEAKPISDPTKIIPRRPQPFAFIQDMSLILNLAKKNPIPLTQSQNGTFIFQKAALQSIIAKCDGLKENDLGYINEVISKLLLLKIADVIDGRLYALESANDWLDMRLENKALYLYRHPLNRILSKELPAYLCTEKNIREAEKSIQRVVDKGWIYFDDFLKGTLVPLSESSLVMLKKVGKTWKYTLPEYTAEEKDLIHAIIFEWLFEFGVVSIGTLGDRECFCVTPFGQSLFGR
jgi:DNA-binding Lrp family transcriptional regulator